MHKIRKKTRCESEKTQTNSQLIKICLWEHGWFL